MAHNELTSRDNEECKRPVNGYRPAFSPCRPRCPGWRLTAPSRLRSTCHPAPTSRQACHTPSASETRNNLIILNILRSEFPNIRLLFCVNKMFTSINSFMFREFRRYLPVKTHRFFWEIEIPKTGSPVYPEM